MTSLPVAIGGSGFARITAGAPLRKVGIEAFTAWTLRNNYFRTDSDKVVTQWSSSPIVCWTLTTSHGR